MNATIDHIETDRYLTREQIATARELCEQFGVARMYGLCGGDYYGDLVFSTLYTLTPRSVDAVRCVVERGGTVDYSYRSAAKRRGLAIRVEEMCRALGTA